MAKAAKRQQVFILVLLGALVVGLAFLMLRDIPAPVAEKTIELDVSHVLR